MVDVPSLAVAAVVPATSQAGLVHFFVVGASIAAVVAAARCCIPVPAAAGYNDKTKFFGQTRSMSSDVAWSGFLFKD